MTSMTESLRGTFRDQIVLVTGGSSGIGNAIVLRFVKEGARVISADVQPGPWRAEDEAVALSAEEAARVDSQLIDASKEKDVLKLEKYIQHKYGKLDICVNNAGIAGTAVANLHDYPIQEWDRVMNLNLRGLFLVLQASIRLMLPHNSGNIINMSSLASTTYMPGTTPYAISKAAVVAVTRQAGAEYGGKGIRVNAVGPGFIETPIIKGLSDEMKNTLTQNPQKRMGQPSEVADMVAFLASGQSAHVVGQTFYIDGGRSAL